MNGFEVVLSLIALAYLFKPFLWVVYRLCPLRAEHRTWRDEQRIPYEDVLYVWASEAWGHLYRIRQHEDPHWPVYRQWAHSIARQRVSKFRRERKNRVERYVANVLEKQAREAARRAPAIPMRREAAR